MTAPPPEFFITANSFAAPFVSDTSERYVTADSPAAALESFAKDYSHPCGLYVALCYTNADAYHKGEDALARWECNLLRKKEEITKDLSDHSYEGLGGGRFKINDEEYVVDDPKGGSVVS